MQYIETLYKYYFMHVISIDNISPIPNLLLLRHSYINVYKSSTYTN